MGTGDFATPDLPDAPDSQDVSSAPGPVDVEALVRKFQKELNAGLVALVLLAVLDRTDEELYGYQIAKQLQGEGEGPVKQGALYPVLRTLSAQGLLTSRVVPSVAGPPRRYYRITVEGRRTLVRWREVWERTRDFVDARSRAGSSGPVATND
jgi:PadR family transcriptional regulator, regulatory protein PadR